jgi:HlyD family type I secretion membrane fusion protein
MSKAMTPATKWFGLQGNGGLDSMGPEAIRGAAVASLFFVGFLGWAAITPLDAAVVANGSIIVAGHRQAVQHLDGGIVRAIHVSEGDVVKEGDIVLELDDTELRSQERALAGRLIELEAQRARLLAEETGMRVITPPPRWRTLTAEDQAIANAVLARQGQELSARSDSKSARNQILGQKVQQLNARLPGFDREREALQQQTKSLSDEIARLAPLQARGLTTVGRLRELEREQARLQGDIGRIDSETSGTLAAIREAEAEIVSLSAEVRVDRAGELREVDTQLSDISPKYEGTVAQLGRTQLRAPASGNVVALTAFTVGGVVEPHARVMDIVPNGKALVIEAAAPPESGDDIFIGAHAQVKLIGVGGRGAPQLHGVVNKMSADRIIDPQTGASFFRMEVTVTAEEMARALGTTAETGNEIRPGIPAEVIIPTRKRTALDYLTEPLSQSFWKSFREE